MLLRPRQAIIRALKYLGPNNQLTQRQEIHDVDTSVSYSNGYRLNQEMYNSYEQWLWEVLTELMTSCHGTIGLHAFDVKPFIKNKTSHGNIFSHTMMYPTQIIDIRTMLKYLVKI